MKSSTFIFFVGILFNMYTLTITGYDRQRQPTNSNNSPSSNILKIGKLKKKSTNRNYGQPVSY